MEPSARYQTVADLAAALGGEKDAGTGPLPDEPPTFEPAPHRRDWLKALLAAMAAVAFVAAVAIILAQTLGAGEKNVGSAPPADEPAVSAPVADDESMADGEPVAGGTAPADEAPALEIVESGWSVDGQGYVHYAFGLRNNGEVQAITPGVAITGRDAGGRVLFSQEQYISAVPAGKTVFFGTLAGDGTAPATIEFAPLPLEDYQVGTSADTSPSFSVIDARPVSDGLGGIKFVGEVATERAGSERGGMGDVALTVVLRDESGAIVYGDTGYATMPAEGESTAFEVLTHGAPEYDTYEVYAQAW